MSVPNDDLLDLAVIGEFRQVPGEKGKSLFDELRELYSQNAPSRLNEIRQALTDPAKLAFHAHALKSMSLNMGARGMVELAQRLEAMGRSGKVDGALELLEQLQSVFERTQKELLALVGE
jgi:HPt (histidine-containing phosphotransfer) domain-containing protein